MSKITANNTHRHDDIADTLADAIRMALIEKTIYSFDDSQEDRKQILGVLNQNFNRNIKAGAARYARDS
jgi:hypothetical protein